MEATDTLYITIGLLYNMGGTMLVGMALLSGWSINTHVLTDDSEQHRAELLFNRTRQYLDGLVGLIMLFSGFALQAMGHMLEIADSNISFLLISFLLFLMLAHFVYIRDIMADDCARQTMRSINRDEKNKAYFGRT